jgi:tRNA(fMet)-specific endonuclease VapC
VFCREGRTLPWRISQREKNLALLADFFPQFVSYSFDDIASEVYGRVRAALMSQGQIIGPNDLLIAAIAIANGLTLVTHNVREFGRVSGLQLEDWEAA